MSKWTLVLAYPDCILFEIVPAAQRLDPLFPVRVATPDGRSFRDDSGLTIIPDWAYRDVQADDCVCVLIPGGNPDRIADNADVARIVHAVRDRGGIAAGICAGLRCLASSAPLSVGESPTTTPPPTFLPTCAHTPIPCGGTRPTASTASASMRA